MAGKNAKRKIAKIKDNRGSSRERGETFDMSSTENLMTATAKSKGRRGGRFPVVAGLLVGLCIVVLAVTGVLAWHFTSGQNESQANSNDPQQMRNSIAYGLSTDEVFNQHRATTLSSASLRSVTSAVTTQSLKQEVAPLLIPRVPDTPGHAEAKNHILGRLAGLGGWTVEQNTFQDETPLGRKTFTNIIATANPNVKRRLILACHYDSKYFRGQEFIGATDSSVPCAQILFLADSLGTALKQANATNPPVTLQLLFFDGEEAFVRWSDRDSLYGSRHLASKMQNTPHPTPGSYTNLLDGMDMFILLDLLGTRNPRFANYFRSTSSWYQKMANIEERLKRTGQTSSYSGNYFNSRSQPGQAGVIQDDHIPFLQKGVRILHIIPSPFPSVWHKLSDNGSALDYSTISNLSKIFHVFVAEYLSLRV